MQCPKCGRENFDREKPCAECRFQGEVNKIDELGHLQWMVGQIDRWETLDIDASSVSKLREIYGAYLKDTEIALGLRQPSFAFDEVEKVQNAWVELAHLETLFEKVEEWRAAGYFKVEMDGQDPVRMQRAHAVTLGQRLEEYQRPVLPQTEQYKLKTVSFLLDQVDLLASRGWFKSKREIEKAVAPIMAVMLDVMSGHEGE
jgi:hypothetical protein